MEIRQLCESYRRYGDEYHRSKVDRLLADRRKLVGFGKPRPEPGDSLDDIRRLEEVWLLRNQEVEFLEKYIANGYVG